MKKTKAAPAWRPRGDLERSGAGLDVPAEAEPVGPRLRLPEPAVAPGWRRRRGAAEHLPHDPHVVVLARAHLLPEPPQPCRLKSSSDAGRS
jgi:hypothetical protein